MIASPGARIGRYTLVRKLAEGGMAEVWQGVDENLGREVAVKVIFSQIASDPDFRERFRREAQTVARLEHEHIVHIYDFDAQECRYLVMPLLVGGCLTDRLKRAVPAAQALAWLRDIASALDFAHAKGVVHRDVKPGNVLFNDAGKLFVSDFGLARSVDSTKLTRTGTMMGTPGYMAPEQINGAAVPASDQFSLGVIAYRALARQLPFRGDSAVEIAIKTLQEATPPPSQFNPDLPPGVDAVLTRALEKDPEQRYPSCTDFVDALERSLEGQLESPVGATPDEPTLVVTGHGRDDRITSLPPPASSWASNTTVFVLAGALLFIALGAVGVVWMRRPTPDAEPPAPTAIPAAPTAVPVDIPPEPTAAPTAAPAVEPTATDVPEPTAVPEMPTPKPAPTARPRPTAPPARPTARSEREPQQRPPASRSRVHAGELPVTLGDSLRKVEAAFGAPAEPLPSSGARGAPTRVVRLESSGLSVFFDAFGTAVTIRAESPFAGTVDGVALGDSLDTLMAKKGAPLRKPSKFRNADAYLYPGARSGENVRYDVDQDSHQVRAILVMRASAPR